MRQAIKDQVDTLAFAHTGFFTNEPMEKLADFLIDTAPDGLERVYFFSGGSEATEASLKLARQYFLEIGKPEKSRIIAPEKGLRPDEKIKENAPRIKQNTFKITSNYLQNTSRIPSTYLQNTFRIPSK